MTFAGSPASSTGHVAAPDGRRRLGIGHLTMLDVSPPDLVSACAGAGFDFVGLRVAAGGPGEELWPLAPGSPMLRETLLRLDDTGLSVNEIDVLAVRPTTTVADAEPAMEVAAILGARYMIAFIEDDDLDRVGALLADLATPAAVHGLRMLVEPMSYKAVHSYAQARRLLELAPATGIVVDPLQFVRSGDTMDDVRALDADTVPFLQMCDGPLQAPTDLPRLTLPRGQSPGTSVTQLEARAWRLPAGEGEMPLAELAAALPDIPVSVEAPNLGLSKLLDPLTLAQRHRAGLDRVLGTADAVSHVG